MNALPASLVVMGGSAGSLDALSVILPSLPDDFPLPVLIVVHLPPARESLLAEVLQRKCGLRVREAEDKDELCPGVVLVAPPDYHLLVEADARVSFCSDEPQLYSRPSIDVLFESAAEAFGPGVIGLLLSGANSDGARGLQAIVQRGGTALVQAPVDAHCPTMPRAALERCEQARAVPLSEVAQQLQELAHGR